MRSGRVLLLPLPIRMHTNGAHAPHTADMNDLFNRVFCSPVVRTGS